MSCPLEVTCGSSELPVPSRTPSSNSSVDPPQQCQDPGQCSVGGALTQVSWDAEMSFPSVQESGQVARLLSGRHVGLARVSPHLCPSEEAMRASTVKGHRLKASEPKWGFQISPGVLEAHLCHALWLSPPLPWGSTQSE